MKIYYIYSNYYDQDWIDEIERYQTLSVFRNKESIHNAMKYALPLSEHNSYEILENGKSSELINQSKKFNMVFAVQALE